MYVNLILIPKLQTMHHGLKYNVQIKYSSKMYSQNIKQLLGSKKLGTNVLEL